MTISDSAQGPSTRSVLGRHAEYRPTEEGFGIPFIDVDEQRDWPVAHRYVHGGFDGTRTLFSFYLPTARQYQGRVLQYLEGGSGGHENVLQMGASGAAVFGEPWQYAYAFEEMGALLIESNQGHGPTDGDTGFHDDVYLFGASAESARFASWLAERIYGAPVRRRYVFGASGGGHRSFQCIMRRPDVYDGAVPEVAGVNPGPYWSALGNAVSLLGADLATVRDALDVGGSKDPFAGLSYAQREALRDLLQIGFPRDASSQLSFLGVETFTLYNTIDQAPGYFADFWTKKGYLGADQPQRLADRLMHFTTTATGVRTGADLMSSEFMVALALATAGAQPLAHFGGTVAVDDPQKLFMARLTVKTGKAAGREMVVSRVTRDGVLLPFAQKCPEMFDDIEPGDEIEVDNRDWIAFCHLYQHNVEWNVPGLHTGETRVPPDYSRFAADGVPVHVQTGTIDYDLDLVEPFPGKVIYIGATADAFIWPTIITSFDQYLRAVLGEKADDQYRLWWVANSSHGRAPIGAMFTEEKDPRVWNTRLVDYEGTGAAALSAVRAWVEDGIAPPPSTSYTLTTDQRLVLPDDAAVRGGVQPVVRLAVNGGARAEVKVGTEVSLAGSADVPPGGGTVVEAEMDFDGTDTWPHKVEGADGSSASIRATVSHVFDKPGTYFPVLRVGAHRAGPGTRTGEPVRNLARVRVVVTD